MDLYSGWRGRNVLDQNTTYNPAGQLTKIANSNGDNDSYVYDPKTGNMTQHQSSIGSTPTLKTTNLTWNSNGTLQSLGITDGFTASGSQTCNYGYDDLARIASVNCTNTSNQNVWNQNFGYDAFGNITKTGSISWACAGCYDATTNHYNATLSGAISYDSNGNLTNDSFHTYTWDPNWGGLASIDSVTLIYDALGRTVEQQGASTTQVMYGPVGKIALMTGQTEVKAFQPLPGGGVIVHRPGSLTNYWRHPDWLGSSRLATTLPGRTKFYDGAYAPFGENYLGSGTTDLDFTGQNEDTVTSSGGLYDFLFREYAPRQGRWISPDLAGRPNLFNPQSWNKYSYVENAPLMAIDPLGNTCVFYTDQNAANVLFCFESIIGPAPNNPQSTCPSGANCPNLFHAPSWVRNRRRKFDFHHPDWANRYKGLPLVSEHGPCLLATCHTLDTGYSATPMQWMPSAYVMATLVSGLTPVAFGNEVHGNFQEVLAEQTGTDPTDWRMSTDPGKTGVDAEYVGDPSKNPGYDYAELKPANEPSFFRFTQQLDNWNLPPGRTALWYYSSESGVIGFSGEVH